MLGIRARCAEGSDAELAVDWAVLRGFGFRGLCRLSSQPFGLGAGEFGLLLGVMGG